MDKPNQELKGREMDDSTSRILAIVVVHGAIGLLQWLIRRISPIPTSGLSGIYLILLPIGFACFNWDISPFFTAAFALVGILMLVWSYRTATRSDSPIQASG